MSAVVIICLGVLLAGCSVFGERDDTWDRNIPESEDFDAYLGTWSPDGTKIAFQHHEPITEADPGLADQLWIVDLGTGEREMVHRGRILSADWSPDGQWFVFHSFSDPEYLFRINVDGQQLTPLTGPDSPNPELRYAAVGRWSPDSRSILYGVVAGEPRGISTMNVDGSDSRLLIPYGIQGSWFPEGERIAYVNWDMTEGDEARMRQIYIANSDGSDVQKLTDLPESRIVSTPSVSPDGRQIAFVHRGRDRSAEIFVMDVDGTNIRQVTDGPGIASRPEWHPNGGKILFGRFIPNVSRRLYILDAETLEVQPVFPEKG